MPRILGITFAFILASLILIVSIFRTSLPNYAFYQPVNSQTSQKPFVSGVDYYFPYTGILPDHPLWFLKAFRDQFWLLVTNDPMRRADLLLLFADKRVVMSKILIKDGKASLGVSTAVKAEQYLEEAYSEAEVASSHGVDALGFYQRIARASLKHREEIEEAIKYAPEDAKPVLFHTLDYPKKVYEKAEAQLQKRGVEPPVADVK